MKEKFKNFIAFTLSEMMIVLLIFSVLTAATLPAITTRKENPNPNIVSGGDDAGLIWKVANNGSIFYDYEDNPREVVINSSSSINAVFHKDGDLGNVGAAVFLTSSIRQVADSTVGLNAYNNSTIEFATGDSNSSNSSGRIALDTLPSIFVGFDNTLSQEDSASGNAYSTLIGRSLGGTTVKALGSTMIGTDTGRSITGGSATDEYSVFIGNNIPLYQTSAKQVVIDSYSTIGEDETFSESNSSGNVLIGQNVAYNLVPKNSVVMGARAGYSATKLSANDSINDVIIGQGASYTNKMATRESVIIGAYAGSCNYSVSNGRVGNVMIGTGAFSSKFYDVAIGSHAGYIKKRPTFTATPATVKIGFYAAYGVSDSPETVYIGSYSGSIAGAYAGAYHAVFIGKSAGYKSSAMGSIGIGEYALSGDESSNTDYGRNVCIGKGACRNANVHVSYSTAIGTGVMGPVNNSSEDYQKALLIGSACYAISGGSNWSNNICIGNGDRPSPITHGLKVSYATGSYSLWGYRDSITYSTAHTIIMPSMKDDPTSYNKSSIVLYAGKVYGGAILRAYSDKRLKENIVPVKHSIDKVRKINVYQYNMKNDSSKNVKIGVIAQELKEIYPQAVSMFNNYFTVNSDWIFFATVRAIKDLDEIVQNVQKELDLAKLKFNNLLVRVNKLEVRMNNISNSNRTLILKLNEIEQAKKMERK